MNWAALSIRRGVTTAMIYLCLTGFGLYTLYNLPVNRLPEVELPVIAIITTYTGASPEDVETLITAPIERAVASVEGVERIESISRQGTSISIVSFTWGRDMDDAEIDVRKNIELLAADLLPDEASRPLTFAFDPSLAPVVFMAVEGPMDPHRLRRIAVERIQPSFGRLEGVAAAEVMGGLDREIQVRLSPTWLQAYGISPSQVVDALRAANVIVPSGAVDDGTQQLSIQPSSTFRSVDEIEDVVVGVRAGRPVVLAEVAEVVDTFEEQTHVVTADGAPAVLIAVRKQSDANTVQVSRTVHEALPALQSRLPEGVRLVPLFDEAESIRRAIANLSHTAWTGFALTALVLLAFLRSWRSSVIALVAIPLSILVAFVVMALLDVTLNLMSFGGLVLAVGMIVDNGIVVLECTFQHVEKERPPDPGPRAGISTHRSDSSGARRGRRRRDPGAARARRGRRDDDGDVSDVVRRAGALRADGRMGRPTPCAARRRRRARRLGHVGAGDVECAHRDVAPERRGVRARAIFANMDERRRRRGRRAWRLLARASLIWLSAWSGPFALALVPLAAGRLCAQVLERPASAGSRFRAGVLFVLHAAATLVAMLVGASFEVELQDALRRTLASCAGALLASMALSLACAPFAFAPFAALEAGRGLAHALAVSFEVAASRGMRATLREGALVGLAGASWAAAHRIALQTFSLPVLLGVSLASTSGTAAAIAAVLGRAYREGDVATARVSAREPRARVALRAIGWMVVPAGCVLLVALVIAIVRPTPMHPLDAPRPAPGQQATETAVPSSERGLLVRAVPEGVVIETADGGGAGLVRRPASQLLARLPRVELARDARAETDVWVAVVDGRWAVRFDGEGVRLDDGLADRIALRWSGLPAALALLGLALAGLLTAKLARSIENARALDAMPLAHGERLPPRGTLARIAGRLRLGGARIRTAAGKARIEGEAHVVLGDGDVVVSLPSEVPLLAVDALDLDDGAEVSIVGEITSLRALGPRQGAIPWPEGARLLPCERDRAVETLVRRAARGAALHAAAIAIAWTSAAGVVLARL